MRQATVRHPRQGRRRADTQEQGDGYGRQRQAPRECARTRAEPDQRVRSTTGNRPEPKPNLTSREPLRMRRHLEVVRSASDSPPHHAEQRKNEADDDQGDADRPQDRDLGDEADDQEYHSECYH